LRPLDKVYVCRAGPRIWLSLIGLVGGGRLSVGSGVFAGPGR